MEINSSDAVSNPIASPANSPKVSAAKPDKEDASGQQAERTDGGPDYQVNLSETAKHNVSGATPPTDVNPPTAGEDYPRRTRLIWPGRLLLN